MWIRSQNKGSLINTNEIGILKLGNMYNILSGKLILGMYSSKEKALGVLDEIQGCITGSIFTNNYEIVRDCKIAGTEFHGVYTMPKDDEVEVWKTRS